MKNRLSSWRTTLVFIARCYQVHIHICISWFNECCFRQLRTYYLVVTQANHCRESSMPKNAIINCQSKLLLSVNWIRYFPLTPPPFDEQLCIIFFIFTGGYYSDEFGYLSTSCKKCPNGSFVAYDRAPGKHSRDCKTCPLGKSERSSSLFFSIILIRVISI